MTAMLMGPASTLYLDEVRDIPIGRRQTLPREMAAIVVARAMPPMEDLPSRDRVGIIGLMDKGDDYPPHVVASQYAIRPHEFSMSVMNSVVGHVAHLFGFRGPQVSLAWTSPAMSVGDVASLYLDSGQADDMAVLIQRPTLMIASWLRRVDDD